jgi:hypothetical protein
MIDMLKKFKDSTPFAKGTPVYLVTKEGEIIEGYTIESSLMDLVSLNCSPLDGTEKQGFTIDNDLLKPNWCAGKKYFVAACTQKEKAEELAIEASARYKRRRLKNDVS